MSEEVFIEICPNCDGDGFRVETNYASREMASDAGDPNLEGHPIRNKIKCSQCFGKGQIATTLERD